MIGLNSGLLGVRRVPTAGSASGLWTPNEQSLAKRAAIWPITGDLYFADVSLLLHMNGSNGSTTFTDSSNNALTVTANGNAQISTAESKFGGASGSFDGSGDYLTIASSALFDFGGGDMTIEFWFKSTQTTADIVVFGREWGGDYTGGWGIMLNGPGGSPLTIYWADYSISTYLMQATGTGYRDGNWHHFAWTKSGNNHTMWLDGASAATATTSATFATVNKNITIGNDLTFGSGARAYLGYLDDLRVTKGVARYTSTFTPPAAQFPD